MVGDRNNILVTGGCGYIGGHVMKALSLSGYNPVAFDIDVDAKVYIEPFGRVIAGDVLDTQALIRVMKEHDISGVVHMAALIYVQESEDFPERYRGNNIGGTASVLAAMAQAGVRDIVFSSTAAVYGFPDDPEISEENPLQPISVYGETKLECERLIQAQGGMNAMIFRYFNAAGCDPDGEVGNVQKKPCNLLPLVMQAAIGKRDGIDVFGNDYDTPDGTALRDYVHVSDLAEMHVRGLEHIRENAGLHIFNLGSGESHSVQDVVDLAKEISGVDFAVRYTPRRVGDPASILARSSKAKAALGWAPRFDLRDMVQSAWDWEILRAKG